jgi:hypothetical protein
MNKRIDDLACTVAGRPACHELEMQEGQRMQQSFIDGLATRARILAALHPIVPGQLRASLHRDVVLDENCRSQCRQTLQALGNADAVAVGADVAGVVEKSCEVACFLLVNEEALPNLDNVLCVFWLVVLHQSFPHHDAQWCACKIPSVRSACRAG